MNIEWQLFKMPFLVIISTLIVSMGLIWHSNILLAEKQQHKKTLEIALAKINKLQNDSEMVLNILQEFHPPFKLLIKQGLIETEQQHRLYWLERLHFLKNIYDLKKLSYHFSKRKNYALPYLVWDKRFQLYVTDMTLNISLKHTQNLLSFLDALVAEKSQLLKQHHCQLKRQHGIEQALQKYDKAHLQVTCQLQWFTIAIAENLALTN